MEELRFDEMNDDELFEALLRARREGVVVCFQSGVWTYENLSKLSRAYYRLGRHDGVKRGRQEGSAGAFRRFFQVGFPCEVCRFAEVCREADKAKCDLWLRWVAAK